MSRSRPRVLHPLFVLGIVLFVHGISMVSVGACAAQEVVLSLADYDRLWRATHDRDEDDPALDYAFLSAKVHVVITNDVTNDVTGRGQDARPPGAAEPAKGRRRGGLRKHSQRL